MLFHLVSAEKFRSQWWFVAGVLLCQAVSAEARPQMGQFSENGLAALFQV
jgi:hypothetical protein